MTLDTRINNGDVNNRVDIIVMGDGYTAADRSTFEGHVDAMTDYLFNTTGMMAEPFGRYAKFFNVHVIYTESAESGTDDPINGVFKNTAFDSSFAFNGGPDRLLYVDNAKTTAVLNSETAAAGVDAEMLFLTVNTTKYGGGGGKYGVFAGGNGSAQELALQQTKVEAERARIYGPL